MRKIPLLVSTALVAAAVITPAATGIASTLSSPSGPVDPNATLPTTSVVAMAVDSAHHQLFISTGAATNSLLVTNESGAVTDTIALNGASGLTLVGNSLYVGESGASDIAVIDTSTLVVTRRLATGANTCPTSVAVVASRYVVYGLSCDQQGGSVAAIDLTSPFLTPAAVPGVNLFSNPIVRAVPNSTTVIVGDLGLDPSGVSIVNVSGSPTVVKSVWELANGCENLQDLAVSPDGQSFVPACGWPYHHDVFSTTDLSQTDSYPTGTYPSAAAFSPDGNTFAGGTQFSYAKALYVLSTTKGNHTLALAEDFGTPWATAPQAVGFSADGATVFAITKAWFGTGTWTFALHALTIAKAPVALLLSVPPAMGVGVPVVFAGRITFADGLQHAVQLQVTRSFNGTTTTLPPVTTGLGDNQFTFTDTNNTTGTATYTVSYAGAAFTQAGSVTEKVLVSRVRPALTITRQVSAGGAAIVTATLVGGTKNRTVTITAKPSTGPTTVVAKGVVNNLGTLSGAYHLKAQTTFTATYTGDAQYLPGTVTITASQHTISPPPVSLPTPRATVAIDNFTTDVVSVELTDPSFDQTFVIKPGNVTLGINYPTIAPGATGNDGISLTVPAGPDSGLGTAGLYFAAGHSYLVRVTYQPSALSDPTGGRPLTWNIIQAS
jgi:hypothetical protein